MHIGTLHPTPPYDFSLSVRLARFHSVLDHFRDGAYWRALDLDGAVVLVRVVGRGTVDAPVLDVYRMAATGPMDDSHLLKRVECLLGVDADMVPFYDVARQDRRGLSPARGSQFRLRAWLGLVCWLGRTRR